MRLTDTHHPWSVGGPCTTVAVADPTPRQAPAVVAAAIDAAIDAALADKKMPASPQADDAEFLRRVTLDLTGTIPTAEQAAAFLDSKEPDKRVKLIDELLASSLYGRHFGTLWHNRIVPLSPENTRNFDKPLFLWLANGFNNDRPWSKTVSELLLAEGERAKNPALGFYLSPLNSVEDYVQADRVAGSVSQLFLGVNLRCAQCHNHPFASWKQTDFWGVAAFFGRVGYTRETKELRLTESRKIRNKDNQPVETARDDASIPIPGKNKFVKARFLGGEEPALAADESFRAAFVAWLTAPRNDRFHKAAVNRLWGQCFGRGLVNPIDNMHDGNPASHPALLQMLADEFAASGDDQKHLLRCICNSKAYQRSSRPESGNIEDATLCSHMALKQLSPEALHDAVAQVCDGRLVDGKDLVKSVTNPGRDHWLWTFSTQEAGEDATRFTHGVPQVLQMLNSQLTNARPPLVLQLCRDKAPVEQAVEKLYRAPWPDGPAPTSALLRRLPQRGAQRRRILSGRVVAACQQQRVSFQPLSRPIIPIPFAHRCRWTGPLQGDSDHDAIPRRRLLAPRPAEIECGGRPVRFRRRLVRRAGRPRRRVAVRPIQGQVVHPSVDGRWSRSD